MTNTTPNMSLILPDVLMTAGPGYAYLLNAAQYLIDSHDHSPGKGVKITPSGLNISSDLTVAQNNITNVRTTRFFNNTSFTPVTADKTVLYALNNELYYIDGAGNNVQITLNGSLDLSSGLAALTIKDSNLVIENASDITKKFSFSAANLTTGTTYTFSLPASTGNDDFVLRTATQTVTNKTLTSSILSGNTAVTLISGSGTLTLPTSGTVTIPSGTDTLVNLTSVQSLSNKTLTSSVLSGNTAVTLISGSGTLTLPTSGTVTVPNGTDTLVNLTGNQIMSNKSFGNTTVIKSGSSLQFNNATDTFSTSLKAGAATSNVTFTLPLVDGTNTQVIQTDGSGNLSFVTQSGGGGSVSAWTAYTPTFSIGFGTVSSISVFWKTVGDSLMVRGTATAGTTTGNAGSISLPSGKSIDNTKISSSASIAGQIVAQDGSVNGAIGTLLAQTGTSTSTVRVGSPYGGANLLANNGTSTTIPSGDSFSFQFEVPWV